MASSALDFSNAVPVPADRPLAIPIDISTRQPLQDPAVRRQLTASYNAVASFKPWVGEMADELSRLQARRSSLARNIERAESGLEASDPNLAYKQDVLTTMRKVESLLPGADDPAQGQIAAVLRHIDRLQDAASPHQPATDGLASQWQAAHDAMSEAYRAGIHSRNRVLSACDVRDATTFEFMSMDVSTLPGMDKNRVDHFVDHYKLKL